MNALTDGRDHALELAHARRDLAGEADRQRRARSRARSRALAAHARDCGTTRAGTRRGFRRRPRPAPSIASRASFSFSATSTRAVGDDALGDAAHHAASAPAGRRLGVQEIHRFRLRQSAGAADRPARDDQRVLEARRGDEPDAGAAALNQRIGRDRRAVCKALGLGEQTWRHRCRRTARASRAHRECPVPAPAGSRTPCRSAAAPGRRSPRGR